MPHKVPEKLLVVICKHILNEIENLMHLCMSVDIEIQMVKRERHTLMGGFGKYSNQSCAQFVSTVAASSNASTLIYKCE